MHPEGKEWMERGERKEALSTGFSLLSSVLHILSERFNLNYQYDIIELF